MLIFKFAACIILGTSGVAYAAKQSDSSYNFDYHGCAEVDLTCFSDPIALPGNPWTPDACKAACQGHKITALFPDACRCGDDTQSFKPLEPSKCDYPCMGDPDLGACGSKCPYTGSGISTIFVNFNVDYPNDGDDNPTDPLSRDNNVMLTPTVFEPGTNAAETEILTKSDPSDTIADFRVPDTILTSGSISPEPSATISATPPHESIPGGSDPDPTRPGDSIERTGDPPKPSEILASSAISFQILKFGLLTGLALLMIGAV